MTLIKARPIVFTLFLSSIVILIVMARTPNIYDTGGKPPASAVEILELISGRSIYKVGRNDIVLGEERYESDGTFKSVNSPEFPSTIRIGTWEIVGNEDAARLRVEFDLYIRQKIVPPNSDASRSDVYEVFIRDDNSSMFRKSISAPTFRSPPRTEFTNESEFNRVLSLVTR